MKIAIIGGGIGGLTAALALVKVGLDVNVYEQAAAYRNVGAGLRITPNATRILHSLGLAEQLRSIGVRTLALRFRRWEDGSELIVHELGDLMQRTFGAPYYHVHRSQLLSILRDAIPSSRLHFGHKLSALDQRADKVHLHFENRASAVADVAIGADGVHSLVRAALHGKESPRFSGDISYRGLVDVEKLPEIGRERFQNMWIGPGRHFVQTFAGPNTVNFIAMVPGPEGRESWSEKGGHGEVAAAFGGWDPRVQEMITAADELWRYPLYDRDPLGKWSAGRVTLLGDAAHPMLPYMAQGAVQSIEDAALIAKCLNRASRTGVEAELAYYEDMRRERTGKIQLGARSFGKLYHLEDGPEQTRRDAEFAKSIAGSGLDRGDWLFSYDIVAEFEKADLALLDDERRGSRPSNPEIRP